MSIPEQKTGMLGLSVALDQKTNPFVINNSMYKVQGWYFSEAAALTKRKGFKTLNQTQLLDDSTSSAFTGLFEYFPSAGTGHKVAMTTVKMYKFGTPVANEWNAIALTNVGGDRTGVSTDLYDSAMLFDQMYVGGGAAADKNIRYTGTTAYQMGIAVPAAKLTVGTPAAGGSMAAGVYSYMYTYVNELGQESNPSPVSDNVTITGGSGNYTVPLTNIANSPDAQVVAKNIYRTTAGGAVWLLLHTIADNTTTTYSDTNSDAVLTLAVEQFANGVPPHFNMIEIFKGLAFMGGDPNNASRVWFSSQGRPACVNSNDYRDLSPNDGDVLKGLKAYQTTVVAFKGYSIWNALGDDRTNLEFDQKSKSVGAVNNACIVDVPVKNVLAFLSPTARFYFYDGVTPEPVATGLEPILNQLNAERIAQTVGALVPAYNQVRWLVPSANSAYGDLMIWYDYVLDKWGTAEIPNTLGNYCATLHDDAGRLAFYLGGIFDVAHASGGGYVWEGDFGGSDDSKAITCEVVDRGHPVGDPNSENQKLWYHLFLWFKPNANVTFDVYVYKDDPDGTPIHLATVSANHASGQDHLHFNITARRLYVRVVESSIIEGSVLRGWRLYFKDVGRHHAP